MKILPHQLKLILIDGGLALGLAFMLNEARFWHPTIPATLFFCTSLFYVDIEDMLVPDLLNAKDS